MQERIAKLPKWAQECIRDLRRQRDAVVNQLNEFIDNQTESPFYIEEMISTGERRGPSVKRHYIQAYTVHLKHAGVLLTVRRSLDDSAINLSWSDDKGHLDHVAFIPVSFQQAVLISFTNMRGHGGCPDGTGR